MPDPDAGSDGLAVFRAVQYRADLIGRRRLETDPALCPAFRPAKMSLG